jgi:hypothetical protein
MDTILRSRHKRAARLTPAVLRGLSLLAACDTDQPIAPETTKASSVKTASAYRSGAPGAIAFNIVDESQVAVTGWTSFWLIDSKSDSTFFEDNNAYFDSNPVSGSYLLKGLTPGTYQVCQHNSPTYYLVANPACLTAKVTTAATTVIGPFVDLHQPKLLWKVVDDDNMLVPGATFVLTDSLNNKAVMTDNGIYDGNKTGGLWQMLAWPQTLKLCETVPPPGYVLPAQPCLTFVAKGGFPTDLGKWVYRSRCRMAHRFGRRSSSTSRGRCRGREQQAVRHSGVKALGHSGVTTAPQCPIVLTRYEGFQANGAADAMPNGDRGLRVRGEPAPPAPVATAYCRPSLL